MNRIARAGMVTLMVGVVSLPLSEAVGRPDHGGDPTEPTQSRQSRPILITSAARGDFNGLDLHRLIAKVGGDIFELP